MRRGDRLRLRCEAERATADSRISKGVDGSGALGSGEAGSGVPLAARRRKWAEGREASQSEARVWGRGAGVAPGAMRRCVWGQLSPTLGQVTVSKGNARVPEFSHRGHLHQCEKVPPPRPAPQASLGSLVLFEPQKHHQVISLHFAFSQPFSVLSDRMTVYRCQNNKGVLVCFSSFPLSSLRHIASWVLAQDSHVRATLSLREVGGGFFHSLV